MSETLIALKQALQTSAGFEAFFKALLLTTRSTSDFEAEDAGKPIFRFGWSDCGYYWDFTQVSLQENGKLTVRLDVGPDAWGGFHGSLTEYEVTFEALRQYLLHRKWAAKRVNTLKLVAAEIDRIQGAALVFDEVFEDEDEEDD